MARQLGLVLGTSAMVGILGEGVPGPDRFRDVWLFLAATSLLAAVAALVPETA
jgi:hypothetical protein